jgi:release factor glutamine methyltransferase
VIPSISRQSCRFGPLEIDYDERVLTPRSWTFHQSEWAAALAVRDGPGPLLELCAGAGHIGLAAAVLADRDLVQVEADPIAAGYARSNARCAGWSKRVQVRSVHMERALSSDERFGVILADPPYLPSAQLSRWPADPPMAIDGGSDGLALVYTCVELAAQHLTAAGSLLLQIAGPGQAEPVAELVDTRPSWNLSCRELRVIDDERAILRLSRPCC